MPRLSGQFALGGCLALLAMLSGSAEARERNVLLLQSLDRGNLTMDYLTGNLRVDVDAGAADPVTFTQFVVNPAGFGASPQQAVIEFLRAAYANRPPPDLIITIGGPAAAFAKEHRRALFPDAPLLLAGVDQRFLSETPLAQNESAVAVANDFTAILEDMLQLFPETSTVFMVIGSGDLGRFWRPEFERDFERFRKRVTFIWSDGLPYSEVLKRAATLPPRSAIFHYYFGTEGQGGAYSEDRVLADFREVANAPVFGTQGSQMGHGIVGGRLMATDELSRASADAAVRILNGASPGSIRTPVQQPGRPVFDWRELQRWGVAAARLPPNSLIRFEPPGVWQRFRWLIVAAASTLLAQTLLIAALVANRVKRRRTEQALRESEERFRLLANAAPVMIWMSGSDMRCTDFNVPWLSFTGRTLAMEQGNGWLDGVHRDDVDRWMQTYEQALQRRAPFRMEYRLRRFDGVYRWILNIGEPRFTPDGSFSGYIGSAIDITELKAARATLSNLNRRLMEAQEQERTRVARELHDDVGQRMTLLSIDLMQLEQILPNPSGEARQRLIGLQGDVAALSKDIQGISHRLHSAKLELLGITVAAGSLCSDVASQRGVTVDYAHENVPAHLPDVVALSLFRVLQEALSNAVKHSGAQHCRVVLHGTPERVDLEVTDDGCGFDVEAAWRGHGLGLISMQERLGLVNGTIVIESKPGAGTTIRASVPVQSRTWSAEATVERHHSQHAATPDESIV
jgi:PAS domain S-box-containing protein